MLVAMDVWNTFRLDVGDGHELHVEEVGSRDGVPGVYLHGGPGSGATASARGLFSPTHRGVLFDQRAAGRSTPEASSDHVHWASIDIDHHVADIERVRERLGIDRWLVVGFSWGSVLGAAYAERHPERVLGLVLGAVSTGTAADIEWLTVHAGRFFPAAWEAFTSYVPVHLRHLPLVDAYAELLHDADRGVAADAATAWCEWEAAHIATTPEARRPARYDDPSFRLAFARQVTHCWRNASWLAPNELLDNAHRLAGIPGALIHGRLDLSGPLDCAWRLHHAWPDSELIIVDGAGHTGTALADHAHRILAELAELPFQTRSA